MSRTGDLVRLPILIPALMSLPAYAQDLALPSKPNARATMRTLDLPSGFRAGTYGKFKGIDQGILFDMNRQQIGTLISQWSGWKFPDAAEIIKMWD